MILLTKQAGFTLDTLLTLASPATTEDKMVNAAPDRQ
jgi:hypothetical protein